METPLYVVPDIHGHADKLDAVLALVPEDAPVVFLGDYVDRGPDSRGVLQRLIDGCAQGRPWVVLRGNHEQMMMDALALLPDADMAERSNHRWFDEDVSGATLASYGTHAGADGAEILAAIPQAHLDFLHSTVLHHRVDDLLFVHAGIRPGITLTGQTAHDLMWMREPFLSDARDHGPLVVHGHSPVRWPEHHGNRVALDGGAGWGRTLHLARFTGRDCALVTAEGSTPLTPLVQTPI